MSWRKGGEKENRKGEVGSRLLHQKSLLPEERASYLFEKSPAGITITGGKEKSGSDMKCASSNKKGGSFRGERKNPPFNLQRGTYSFLSGGRG